jgi:hypothetical protein
MNFAVSERRSIRERQVSKTPVHEAVMEHREFEILARG